MQNKYDTPDSLLVHAQHENPKTRNRSINSLCVNKDPDLVKGFNRKAKALRSLLKILFILKSSQGSPKKSKPLRMPPGGGVQA